VGGIVHPASTRSTATASLFTDSHSTRTWFMREKTCAARSGPADPTYIVDAGDAGAGVEAAYADPGGPNPGRAQSSIQYRLVGGAI
jgi:hypothetical protein